MVDFADDLASEPWGLLGVLRMNYNDVSQRVQDVD
jgi:hypothetical protein